MKLISFILQVSTIIIPLFSLIKSNNDNPERIKPLNRHGDCEIVINELFTGPMGYVEIAKVCPLDDRKQNLKKELRGFAIIVLSVKNLEILCVYSTKLQKNVLKTPTDSPATSSVVPGTSRRTQSVGTDTDLQTNALFFLNVPVSNIKEDVDSHILYLLRLNSAESRRSLPCHSGSKVTEKALEQLNQLKHDSLIIKTTTDLPWFVIKTIPSEIYSTNQYFIPMQDQSGPFRDYSYGRCKSNTKLSDPGNFKFNTKSPESPNNCEVTRPFLFNPVDSFLPPYGPFTGQKINAMSLKIVMNVLKSLETFRNNDQVMKLEPKKLTAKLTNLALSTVYSAERQHKEGKIDEPVKPGKRICPVMDLVDDNVKHTLYKSITGFYAQNKVPTLEAIYQEFLSAIKLSQLRVIEQAREANEEIPDGELFHCGLSTFQKILKLQGYKYGKINLRDSVILSPKFLEWRSRYIHRIKENDRTGERTILWLDETWSDPNKLIERGWVKKCYQDVFERREFTFPEVKVSKGRRIIIIAAGNQNGFIPGSQLVLKISKSDSSLDYHKNINQASFTNWFLKLLDTLDGMGPKKFLIVMDNASYHTTLACPKSNSNKREMLQWIREQKQKGYSVPDGFEKLDNWKLKDIIRELKKHVPHHRIDNLASDRGHQVLRLPPYSPDLNPIELVWKDIKHSLKKSNIDQDLDNHFERAKVLLHTYGSDKWNAHCSHVQKIQEQYVQGDASFQNVLNQNPEVEDLYNAEIPAVEVDHECDDFCGCDVDLNDDDIY